jgi:hypothetical protein
VIPVQPPVFSGGEPLPWDTVHNYLAELEPALSRCKAGRREVTVSLLGLHLADAVRDGLFSLEDVQEDADGQLYCERPVGRHLITFLLQVLPETGRHSLRILHTGEVLPNTHYLQVPEPSRFSVGDVRSEALDRIYARAIGPGSALSALWDSRERHECRDRPCWPLCFGGLAASDHNLAAGLPLDRKPRLCLKFEEHDARKMQTK